MTLKANPKFKSKKEKVEFKHGTKKKDQRSASGLKRTAMCMPLVLTMRQELQELFKYFVSCHSHVIREVGTVINLIL